MLDNYKLVINELVTFSIDDWESPSMLDAPVSGGVLAAETGSLTFMV